MNSQIVVSEIYNQSQSQNPNEISQYKTYLYNSNSNVNRIINNNDILNASGIFTELATILHQIIDYENQIESIRVNFAMKVNFNKMNYSITLINIRIVIFPLWILMMR